MSTTIRKAAQTGLVFAIVIIFLDLIGFVVTGATIIGKFTGTQVQPNALPPVKFYFVYIALLGLWNGYLASASAVKNRQSHWLTLASGLAGGVVAGVIVALYSMVLVYFLDHKIDPRPYLAYLSADAMKFSLYNQPDATGVITQVVMISLSGLLGGALAAFFASRAWKSASAWTKETTTRATSGQAFIGRLRASPYARYVLYALLVVLLFVLPQKWGSYWNYVIGLVGIYVLLGLGLNIIVGYSGQLVLGYVTFFAFGAYTVALLNAPKPHDLMWGFWISTVLGVLMAVLAGILVALPILRLRGDYLAIVTLGFGEIIRVLLKSDLLTPITAGPRGVQDIHGPVIFGRSFSSDIDFMYLILIAVILLIFITDRLYKSRVGRAWSSIREDETVSQATGVNNYKYKLLALAIGAAFAGLGGVLFAARNQYTGPDDHALMVSINVLCVVIVGGIGSIPGIILGSFVLKGLPEILREVENYRMLVFGGLLIVMMILRPEGLWPAKSRQLEHKLEKTAPSELKEEPEQPPVEVTP